MKITRLRTRLIEIDPRPRYKDEKIPAGRPKVWKYPFVIVETDCGLEGFSMAYGPHGDGEALAYELHSVYGPEILGEDPLDTEKIWQKMVRKQRHLYNQSGSLIGVIDIALWDLKGKAAGLSVARLLGRARERMPCYASARSEAYTTEEFVAEALAMRDAGFHGYKLQARAGAEADIPRLRAVREAVGPDFPLMHDPNAAYDLGEALRVGRVLDELGYHWYEEPIPETQVSHYKVLCESLATPILATETSTLGAVPEFLRHNALSMGRGDVLIKGGVTGLRKMMAACELFGINVEIHTTNTPLLDVANLHVACAAQNTTMIENHHPIFRFGIKDNPLEPDEKGYVTVPDGPGLGVDLDWDWIATNSEEWRP